MWGQSFCKCSALFSHQVVDIIVWASTAVPGCVQALEDKTTRLSRHSSTNAITFPHCAVSMTNSAPCWRVGRSLQWLLWKAWPSEVALRQRWHAMPASAHLVRCTPECFKITSAMSWLSTLLPLSCGLSGRFEERKPCCHLLPARKVAVQGW